MAGGRVVFRSATASVRQATTGTDRQRQDGRALVRFASVRVRRASLNGCGAAGTAGTTGTAGQQNGRTTEPPSIHARREVGSERDQSKALDGSVHHGRPHSARTAAKQGRPAVPAVPASPHPFSDADRTRQLPTRETARPSCRCLSFLSLPAVPMLFSISPKSDPQSVSRSGIRIVRYVAGSFHASGSIVAARSGARKESFTSGVGTFLRISSRYEPLKPMSSGSPS